MRRNPFGVERHQSVTRHLAGIRRRCSTLAKNPTIQSPPVPPPVLSLKDLLAGGPIAVDSDRISRRRAAHGNDGITAPAGIYATTRIPAGSLLGVIPISCIVAPATTALTLGHEIAGALSAAVVASSSTAGQRMTADVSSVSCATALHMLLRRSNSSPAAAAGRNMSCGSSFIGRYLSHIVQDCDVISNRDAAARTFREDVLRKLLRQCHIPANTASSSALSTGSWLDAQVQAECERYVRLSRCREDSVAHLERIMSSVMSMMHPQPHHSEHCSISMQAQHLKKTVDVAHGLCESRCVTIPNGALCLGGAVNYQSYDPTQRSESDPESSDDTFTGGPALVPFVDLLNHRNGEPNVTIACMTDQDEIERMLRIASRRRLLNAHALCSEVDCMDPLLPVVIVVAAGDIAPNDELHYQYSGTDTTAAATLHRDQPLQTTTLAEWALRFHFIP
jgi:hypothetical protein